MPSSTLLNVNKIATLNKSEDLSTALGHLQSMLTESEKQEETLRV
jgi:hypothetical protein